MADSRTDTVLKRRSIAKTGGFALVGVGLGLILKAAFGFEPADAFFSSIESLTDWFSGLKTLLDANPDARGWVVGPVALGMLFLGLANIGWLRRNLLDRLFPDPPPFVRSDLDEARSRERMITLEGPPLPFVGRRTELAELEELLGEPGRPFRWRALTGPSGIGKTRLGIEWLAAAEARGWDVGIIDRNDCALLKGWRPRRSTALIIDEARRDWDDELGEFLADLACPAGRVLLRVLVIDQIDPYVAIKEGEARDRVQAGRVMSSLRLAALADDEVGALRAALGHSRLDEAVVVQESAGRPRAALILMNAEDATSFAGALGEWVERFVPGVGDLGRAMPQGLVGPLFISALAGPIDTDVARDLFGQIHFESLVRFYSDESRRSLERQLPKLLPDDLAQELLLRLFARLDIKVRQAAVDHMILAAPATVEMRLGAIWRDRPDLNGCGDRAEATETLLWLQKRFDDALPERLARQYDRMNEAVNAMAYPDLPRSLVEASLASIAEVAAMRPFDSEIRLGEIGGLFNAVRHYGGAKDISAADRCARRIWELVGADCCATDARVRFQEAKTACSMIDYYGAAGDFAALARCGERLIDLAEDEAFAGDGDIRLHEAMGAVNALLHYGMVGEIDQLDRWSQRLIAVIEHESFASDPQFRVAEATGAMNAIEGYGRAGNLDGMEKWWRRLERRFTNEESAEPEIRHARALGALAAIARSADVDDRIGIERWEKRLVESVKDGEFAQHPFLALRFAMAAIAAISHYGRVHDLVGLERWGDRLSKIVSDEKCALDPEIREFEAQSAVNAIGYYASISDVEAIARWGARLTELAEGEAHSANGDIIRRVAMGAVNAMMGYGGVGDFAAMEAWGKRLIDLANDKRFCDREDILEDEAKGTANAIIYYGRAGRHDWPAAIQWRRRLAGLAAAHPAHVGIQYVAGHFGLTAANQRAFPTRN